MKPKLEARVASIRSPFNDGERIYLLQIIRQQMRPKIEFSASNGIHLLSAVTPDLNDEASILYLRGRCTEDHLKVVPIPTYETVAAIREAIYELNGSLRMKPIITGKEKGDIVVEVFS